MPELKNVLLIVLQDLINHIMYNISKVRKFFPLKDSISNFVYLYLTECKIDVKNTSLQNINVRLTLSNYYILLPSNNEQNVKYIPLMCAQK